jgi:hypothetical protein
MSSGDKEVADMGDGSHFIGYAINVIDGSFDGEFLGV